MAGAFLKPPLGPMALLSRRHIKAGSVRSYAHFPALGPIFSICGQLMKAAFFSELHKLSILLQSTGRTTTTSRQGGCTRGQLLAICFALGFPQSRPSAKDLGYIAYLQVTLGHIMSEEGEETREGGEAKTVTLTSLEDFT